jgi:hypothetical protein
LLFLNIQSLQPTIMFNPKRIKNWIFIVILFIFSSCISSRYIDIQVLHPAQIKIPSTYKNIHIVTPESYPSTNQGILQQALANSFIKTLKKNLEDSPRFNGTNIEENNIKDIDNKIFKLKEKEKNTHLLIQFLFGVRIETSFDYDTDCYLLRYIIKVENHNSTIKCDKYDKTDTFYFPKNAETEIDVRNMAELGNAAAIKYAQRFAVYWIPEERQLFYSYNKYLRKGYNFLTSDKLPEARENWEKLYNIGTDNLASIAAHNIALLCEMEDNLDDSEAWIRKSLQKKYRPETERYFKVIIERKAQKASIDEQLK